MKLPSLRQVSHEAADTFLRFPLVLINAALGTICAVILTDHQGPAQPTVLFNILAAALAGIPLLTAIALFSEKKKWGPLPALSLQSAGIILLVIYSCSLPLDLAEAPAVHLQRLAFIFSALCLLATFAPYSRPGEINGFWHYNKILFMRLMLTMIYTVVLYIGLALALAALDNLFAIDVPGRRYAQLWFILLGLFTTWSFLAGIPENLDKPDRSENYPKVVKIFAQYILSPLVLVYLFILYAYIIRILIIWDWPQGWVGRLILGFAASGIFALLLLHPIRDRAGNKWITRASNWFYLLMIPVVVMLLLALWRRISEYGLTEGRYLGMALGIWLGGIVGYFIISKIKSIKVIPVSLCLLALLISYGPWSAFAVSEKSQVERLGGFLVKNHILAAGHVQKAPGQVSLEDSRQISSILAYLHDVHGYQQIQSWFSDNLNEDSTGRRLRYKSPMQVAEIIGIEYQNVRYSSSGNTVLWRSDQSGAIPVEGYQRLIRGKYISHLNDNNLFTDQELQFRIYPDLKKITFINTPAGPVHDSLLIDLNPMIDRLITNYPDMSASNIPADKMMLTAEDQLLKVKIFLRYMKIRREKDIIKPLEYSMDILYSTKEE